MLQLVPGFLSGMLEGNCGLWNNVHLLLAKQCIGKKVDLDLLVNLL